MIIVGQSQGKAVISTVLRACVVIGRTNNNHRLNFAVRNPVVENMLHSMRFIRAAEIGILIAPTAVHKIEHGIFLTFVIAIGQIYDSVLLKLLALFVVGKRFVSIVIKVLQGALLFRLGQVTVGNWDEFIRKSVYSFVCFGWYTAVFAFYVIVFIRGLRSGRTTRR